jgi:RecB family exonuclease
VARGLISITPTLVKPKLLTRVSPSLGERLLACELSVAFRLDGRYEPLRRPSPASALGNVAHDLAERVAEGKFDGLSAADLKAGLSTAWENGVANAERELADAYDVPPPSPSRWPGYAQTRTRTLAHLIDEAERRDGTASTSDARLYVEEDLAPAGIPLHGRADRVEHHAGGAEIVDLKTGWSLPDELKSAHRRQLLAYAFLWHATHGEWPERASIQRLDGARMSFDVSPAEAEAVATELIAALERYNLHVADGSTSAALATPSADACRYCAYRAACAPFFASASTEWGWFRRSVLGEVTSAVEGRTHTRIEIDVDAGTTGRDHVSIINFPPMLAPDRGERLAIIDVTPTAVESDFRLSWDSTITRWERE